MAIFTTRDYLLKEETMTSKQRNSLKDSDFGIPDKRKYPLNDVAHVKAAIRMFNHVSKADEKQLASKIKSAMRKFNIKDVEIGKDNRLSKYI